MLSVDEALALVWQHAVPLAAVEMPAGRALGLPLAEAIVSDIDSPPYDKAMMDGYAVVAADLASGSAELEILEEITAGTTPTLAVRPGCCSRIMTGAPIPSGADAVVMVEQTQVDPVQPGLVRIQTQITSGRNILTQGTSLRQGAEILAAGTIIRPIEVGILAEVGRDTIAVRPAPTVSILSTGDELVPASIRPAAGQIRNSNGPMLEAMVRAVGATPAQLGIARDVREELSRAVERGLESDLLILSGGVSAGVLDLVPSVLAEQGVEQVFHKVNMKPGKPLWFGKRVSKERTTLVFGLPGNPVSSLVGFHLFVRHALNRLAGRQEDSPLQIGFQLTAPFANRGDRPVFFPSAIDRTETGESTITPLDWKGSADLATLTQADALAYFPAEAHCQAGEFVAAVRL